MKKQTPTTSNDPAFAAYIRDVGKHPVLSVAEERSLGAELVELRTGYWKEALSYPPFTEAAAQVILEQLGEKANDFNAEPLARAARAARDTNRKAAADGFARELQAFAEALASVDGECLGADRVSADLETLASGGRGGVSMDVRPPRAGSRPFADYAARVRRARTALDGVRNRFARANLRLVIRIASRFQRAALSLHDRVQEGNIGLMKAIDRFDPTKGFRFSTYASWWIKHAIRRAAVNRGRTVRLPAHLQATAGKLSRARVELRHKLNREPTHEELAVSIETPLEKVEIVVEAIAQRSVSLDAPSSDGDDRAVIDTLVEDIDRDIEDVVADGHDAMRVRGKLLSLGAMERDILCQRFGLNGEEPRTLTEIGRQYSLSRERIRQLQAQALRRLRGRLEPHPAGGGRRQASVA